MKKEISFIAFDGKRFNTETECCKYEKGQKSIQKAYRAIHTLATFCEKTDCASCPFCNLEKYGCKFMQNFPSRWRDKSSSNF